MRYCIVNSGRGPTDGEVGAVCEAVEEIKQTVDIDICCCLGLLSESQAHQLKFAGVGRVNHNLNTSQNHHDTICTTHTYEDRIRTLQIVKEAGLATCSGGILGMGESPEDILDLAFALRDIGADSIPVNFLHPIDGTPFRAGRTLTPRDCLRILCLFRFVNPTREIRVAGGRERNIRSLQPLPWGRACPGMLLSRGGHGQRRCITSQGVLVRPTRKAYIVSHPEEQFYPPTKWVDGGTARTSVPSLCWIVLPSRAQAAAAAKL